ncbi:UDP-glucose 4-epimerase GalE [Priestia sp. Y58]|uniref:UDP-glucose 4-epimerase GalE n=1 Tax=Priestia sp. Y58 TaxID=2922804 RepID=UPI002406BD90|nr:UDP-glucose 4-epimerase GalE [Priestia sp. Y58]MDG0030623.1 UDP-glucose 4-epimerase GalE [Priestia sp. Y58]
MILITGGAGYIGSHTCVELLNAGYEIVVVDNFSNSNPEVINRIKNVTGKDFVFVEADLLDQEKIEGIFHIYQIDAVIHFAGFKAVGESVEIPLTYYHNNITSTLLLCSIMDKFNVKKMVFSSSATVYGDTDLVPIQENSPLSATNPYGNTKLMVEQILKDLSTADDSWSIALLRYFNPIGAHISGLLGENPNGIPNNLLPYISKVASGELEYLNVFGNDYPTKDGTGMRDYIHVVDLSLGHVKALNKILYSKGIEAYNLGTGNGYTVIEVINAYEEASGKKVDYKITPRRPGDIAISYADPKKAKRELGWAAIRSLDDMCRDSWNFVQVNPNGIKKTNIDKKLVVSSVKK